jgi:CheY-like chemotaxis protein
MNALGTVLLVEDNEDDAELVAYAVDKAGIANPLFTVSDGDTAIAYVEGLAPFTDRAAHPVPVLILLDLKLPRRSGFEVLQRIRANGETKRTPVVVLTSSGEQGDIDRAYDLGANSYLVKPVSRDTLLAMIKTLDAYWIKLNRVTAV